MFKRFTSCAAIAVISLCFGELAQAQFGGLQVQVGGYGSGVRVGGFGYGNGIYGNGYGSGYGNGYGNPYGNRYGNAYGNINNFGYGNGLGNGFGSVYQSSYGSYRQPGTYYLNRGYNSGFGYRSTPNYSYGSSRYYSAPVARYGQRRFR